MFGRKYCWASEKRKIYLQKKVAVSDDKSSCEKESSDDSKEKFINDFIQAWNKVMNADRCDLL